MRAWAIWGCKRRTAFFLGAIYLVYLIGVGVWIAYAVQYADCEWYSPSCY